MRPNHIYIGFQDDKTKEKKQLTDGMFSVADWATTVFEVTEVSSKSSRARENNSHESKAHVGLLINVSWKMRDDKILANPSFLSIIDSLF